MSTLVMPYNDYGSKVGQPAVGAQVESDLTAILNHINGANIAASNLELPLTSAITWDIDGSNSAVSILSSNTVSDIEVTRSGAPILAASEASLKLESQSAETAGIALASFELTSASASIPVVRSKANSTSPLLEGQQLGSGPYLKFGDGSSQYLSVSKSGNYSVIDTPAGTGHKIQIAGSDSLKIEDSLITLTNSSSGDTAVLSVPTPGTLETNNINVIGNIDATGDVDATNVTAYDMQVNHNIKFGSLGILTEGVDNGLTLGTVRVNAGFQLANVDGTVSTGPVLVGRNTNRIQARLAGGSPIGYLATSPSSAIRLMPGIISLTGGGIRVNYAAFGYPNLATAAVSVFLQVRDAAVPGGTVIQLTVNNNNTTGFDIVASTGASMTVYWMAVAVDAGI